MCVRPHVDEELDKRKHVYRGIDSVLVSSLIQFIFDHEHWKQAVKSGRANISDCSRRLRRVFECCIFSSTWFVHLPLFHSVTTTEPLFWKAFSSLYRCVRSGRQRRVSKYWVDGVSRWMQSRSFICYKVTHSWPQFSSEWVFIFLSVSSTVSAAQGFMSTSSQRRCKVQDPEVPENGSDGSPQTWTIISETYTPQ